MPLEIQKSLAFLLALHIIWRNLQNYIKLPSFAFEFYFQGLLFHFQKWVDAWSSKEHHRAAGGKGKEMSRVVSQDINSRICMNIYIRMIINFGSLFKALDHPTFFSLKSGVVRRNLIPYSESCFVSNIWHQIMHVLLKPEICILLPSADLIGSATWHFSLWRMQNEDRRKCSFIVLLV